MIMDKTSFYLVLSKAMEDGGQLYLSYNAIRIGLPNSPLLKIFTKIHRVYITVSGLQLSLGNSFGYVDLDKSIGVFDDDFEFNVIENFEGDIDERGVYFHFTVEKLYSAYISIQGIEKTSYHNLLDKLESYKKEYLAEYYEDLQERISANEMMPDGFWDSIDNMMEW